MLSLLHALLQPYKLLMSLTAMLFSDIDGPGKEGGGEQGVLPLRSHI
jgi:hypothetical protein